MFFSLGLTLIEAATLEKITDLNNFSEKEKEMRIFIENNVKSSYLKKILPEMMKFDPKFRISFRELNGEEEEGFNENLMQKENDELKLTIIEPASEKIIIDLGEGNLFKKMNKLDFKQVGILIIEFWYENYL